MHSLSTHDLMQIWEQGENCHPIDQALILLTAACPEKTWQELAMLNIGRRDALLLTVRQLTFGAYLNSFAHCPQCATCLEFTVNTADLLPEQHKTIQESEWTLFLEAFEVRFRLPNSLDLAVVARTNDIEGTRNQILQNCILQVCRDGAEIATEMLPETVTQELVTHMATCDPFFEVQLNLDCSVCHHHWRVLLDITSFFWREITFQARHLLHEVHILAQAYSWCETDILALNQRRRQAYLEMVI